MDKKIIMSKLHLPNPGKRIINRDRLLSKADDLKKRKVAYVIAPAGYGKTVFIKQLVDRIKMPFIWYQIDPFDNDPVQFFQYLLNGISAVIPDFQTNILEFSSEDIKSNRKYYNIMTAIISGLETKADKGLIIVFDDFHLINETELLQFMECFLNCLCSSVHVIISCRHKPELNLLRLKTSGNIMEVDQQDLEFSQSEAIELFRSKGRCSLTDSSLKKFIASLMDGLWFSLV